MSRPTKFVDWALDDTVEPRKQTSNKIAVPDSIKNNGILDGILPLNHLNENFNLLGQWVRFLDAAVVGAADNIVPINSIDDFPAAVAGVITLEAGKHYLLNAVIVTSNRFVLPAGIIKISGVTLGFALVYLGSDALFTGDNFGVMLMEQLFVAGNPSCSFFDTDNAGSIFLLSSVFSGCSDLGTIKNSVFAAKFVSFEAYEDNGFVFDDRTDAVRRANISFIDCGFIPSTTNAKIVLDVRGDTDGLLISNCTAFLNANETLFDLNTSLSDNDVAINVDNFRITPDPTSVIFAPNSLDQSYVNAIFSNNINIPDSTTITELSLTGNSAQTTITVIGQNEPIAVNTTYSIDGIIERFMIQDVCTFDNTGNTVDTTFNHGLILDDRVFLNAYAGSTLPAELDETTEYFVVNPNAADFQLALTAGGSAISFTDNGTGALQYRHSTGVSESAEMIYSGKEDIKIKADGWMAIVSTTGTAVNNSSAIMRIALDGTITEDQFGSTVTVDNTDSQSSVDIDTIQLVTGEGVVLNVRNDSNTTNLIVENYVMTLTKV